MDEELDASALEEELVDPDELRDPVPARARSPSPRGFQINNNSTSNNNAGAGGSHAQSGPPSYNVGGGMGGGNGFGGIKQDENDEDRVRPSEMPDEGSVVFSFLFPFPCLFTKQCGG